MPSLGGGRDGWIAGVKNRFTDISDLLGLAARSVFAQATDVVSDATRELGVVTLGAALPAGDNNIGNVDIESGNVISTDLALAAARAGNGI